MRVIALAITTGAALALMTGAASAQQQFNGLWSVEVIPQRGNCQQTYRFPVLIQDGQVRYGGSEGIATSGAVTPRGFIRGSIGAGSVQADVKGRLSGRSGSGTWVGVGGFSCSGQWRAVRSA
jgi:hypothetical protein